MPPKTERPWSSLETILLVAVTILAAVVRVWFWKYQTIISVDGSVFVQIAKSLTGGPETEALYPYGYPLLISLAHLFQQDWMVAAKVVDFLAGVALVPLLWILGRMYIQSIWLRLLAPLAAAVLPLTVVFSLLTLSEMPYLVFLTAMFIAISSRRPVLAGVLGGIAYATRPEGLITILVLGLLLLLQKQLWRRYLLAAAAVVVVCFVFQGIDRNAWQLAVASPAAEQTWWETKTSELLSSGASATPGIETTVPEVDGSSVSFVGNLKNLLIQGGWLAPVLGLVGLFSGAGILIAGVAQLVLLPFFGQGDHPRLILPFLPFLWVAAAIFLDRLKSPLRWGLLALTLGGFAFTIQTEQTSYRLDENALFVPLVEVGEWLRPQVTPQTVIYDLKPYAAYYAGAQYRTLPEGSYEDALDQVVKEGGDFVVLHQPVAAVFRKDLLPLVTDKPVTWHEPRLAPVHINNKYLDSRALVFRVLRPGGPSPLTSESTIKREIGIIEHSPNHFFHGELAMRSGNYIPAAGEFAYVNESDPDNSVAWNYRAQCLVNARQALEQASSYARRAIQLDPENEAYYQTLIEILTLQQNDRAADLWRQRLEDVKTRKASSSSDTDSSAGD
ncbi:MAG: tetratricopeptide repeat protein [Candidatus Eisenbacteria bacterium]|uniref:Tetratricopeptide repeat protein n=1 Tax=Eiseniibacteriota bacterium TaxID=2212470 RepID=A0A7Y2EAZ1_UNCEI|nr:tetratricopeptide repeat protein [Candidatus Eisenbacteria bacterium]